MPCRFPQSVVMSAAGIFVVWGFALAALLAHSTVQATTDSTFTDLFSWSLDYFGGGEAKSGESEGVTARDCSCDGPSCTCCLNFTLSYIDLGGPGCVKMKYLSQAEGLMVNVSYGDNVLHSEKVKGPKPEPACMDLLSDIAQVCARFTQLDPDGEGLRGCTVLEPTLLGAPQARYPVGCFNAGPQGMKLDPNANITGLASSEEEEEEESADSAEEGGAEGPTEKPDLSEEALINAVNEGAEEGIAWFTSLLGISFGGGAGKKNVTEETTPTSTSSSGSQGGRSLNEIPLK